MATTTPTVRPVIVVQIRGGSGRCVGPCAGRWRNRRNFGDNDLRVIIVGGYGRLIRIIVDVVVVATINRLELRLLEMVLLLLLLLVMLVRMMIATMLLSLLLQRRYRQRPRSCLRGMKMSSCYSRSV